jgi:hypothetical protein
MLVTLLTIGYIDPSDSSTGTLCFTNAQGGYRTHATDTPANQEFIPQLDECRFRLDPLHDEKGVGSGTIEIGNADGALDDLLDLIYDGQAAMVYLVDPTAAFSTAVEVARWVVEQPESNADAISFRTRTPTYHLDVPLQTDFYGGTGNVDGDSTLTNKPKPLAWGIVVNAPAVLVNASQLIYQLSSAHDLSLSTGTDATGLHIYDAGVEITHEGGGAGVGNYTSVADMLADPSVTAGQYQTCPATASGATYKYATYVKLGSTPTGEVTFDGQFFPSDGTSLTSRFLSDLIRTGTGDDADVYAADQTAVGTTFPYAVGLFAGTDVGTPPTYVDAANAVLTGMRGWIVPYQGVPTQSPASGLLPPFAVRWLDTPATAAASPYANSLITGTAALTIAGETIEPRSFTQVAQYDFGWPEWRVTLQTDRTVDVQTTGLAGAVTLARRLRLAAEYLTVADSDPTVQDHFPTAVDRVVTTGWSSDVGTIANEATRQLGVFSDAHQTFTMKAYGDLYQVALAVPGDPVTITNYPRYGCDVSRDFCLLSLEIDYLNRRDGNPNLLGFSATLWG